MILFQSLVEAGHPRRGSLRFIVSFSALLSWGCMSPCYSASQTISNEDPTWVSADARLVTFDFDPQRTYLILTRPKVVTHLQLAEDETVTTVVVGDSANFSVILSANHRHVLIRPKYEGLTTSVTLITSEREYPLILRSTKAETGKWYQRVSWVTPELRLKEFEPDGATQFPWAGGARQDLLRGKERVVLSDLQEQVGEEEGTLLPKSESLRINLDLIRTNYLIEGSADFKPLSVFDDGSKTYLRLPEHYQNFPAVFSFKSGNTQLVNYSVQAHYIVVQGVHAGLILKLGDSEVKVTKEVRSPSPWFGVGP
jgi:type IV secretion system protein TrbG